MSRPRFLAGAILALMWLVVTVVREVYFDWPDLAWWGLLAVAVSCAFSSGWVFCNWVARVK